MPYWLETDTFGREPVWEALAGGNVDKIDRLQAAYCRLKAAASAITSDGYLMAQAALDACRGRRQILDLLCTAVLDQDPLIHRPGDECPCLGETWVDGYAYRIHNFLRKNPSRREYNRNKAQKADLRNPALKKLVYDRDGGCCRYCRSGPLTAKAVRSIDRRKVLVYDHVDPDQPATPDGGNFVVNCDACNTHKGRRTPYEADMKLLPVPTPQERHQLRTRAQQLHDRPVYTPAELAPGPSPITDESPTNHRHDVDPITDRITDPNSDQISDPDRESAATTTPSARHQQPDHRSPSGGTGPPDPLGSGRGGQRADDQPVRDSADVDVYNRRPRTYPGPPEYEWPKGSVPATRNQDHVWENSDA